eukprot:TRINITY_DN15174_c0_g1::TRINITY_DN15174_c0_g1_i1::g.30709::m.30709 TRINITY_DN15174_c0_g1::TRINITY_DN15174_c0_g1_i1::g.30709  ORF type:complete len:125 (+),score=4.94,DUF2365/PF10157.4/9.2e-12,PhoU_div/PF01865.11/0.013,DUF2408/PF10303.4/0.023,DUF2150/PF09920.4/0.026,SNARE/PF05739.14/0.065,mit_SMPDase/PF14724.1/0.043,Fzo_mitofusin/PF04799.8/0.15,NodZ/PF05830.6/0.082,DUF607/PF04678.8/0.1 TRINITY_DN15174_c0_g1_i1:82-456(+)
MDPTEEDLLRMQNALTLHTIEKMEENAVILSQSVASLLHELQASMEVIVTTSNQYVDTYAEAVHHTEELVEDGISAMAELIKQCHELNNNLKPLEITSSRIRTLRLSVEYLEALLMKTGRRASM